MKSSSVSDLQTYELQTACLELATSFFVRSKNPAKQLSPKTFATTHNPPHITTPMAAKRTHADMEGKTTAPANGTHQSPFMPMFEHFRAELDSHHERRERCIKASRDITAASKKIIFTLQRVRALAEPLPAKINSGNEPYYTTIATQFRAVCGDLQGLNAHRYARNISGGCQEYIEAATFEHYLTTGTLLSYEEAAAKTRALSLDAEAQGDASHPGVELTPEGLRARWSTT